MRFFDTDGDPQGLAVWSSWTQLILCPSLARRKWCGPGSVASGLSSQDCCGRLSGRLRGAPWLPFLHISTSIYVLTAAHGALFLCSENLVRSGNFGCAILVEWLEAIHPIYSTIACSENGRQMGTAGIAMPSYARLSLLVSDEARVSTDSQSSPNGVRYMISDT